MELTIENAKNVHPALLADALEIAEAEFDYAGLTTGDIIAAHGFCRFGEPCAMDIIDRYQWAAQVVQEYLDMDEVFIAIN